MEEFCKQCGGPMSARSCSVCGLKAAPAEGAAPGAPLAGSGADSQPRRQRNIWKGIVMATVAAVALAYGATMLKPTTITASYPEAVVKANELLFRGLQEHQGGDNSTAMRSWKQAVTYFERALELEPGDLQSRSDLGLLYFYMGDGPKAVAAMKQVLEQDDKYLLALFNLGWMNRIIGQEAKARDYMQRYLDAVETERVQADKYRDQTLIDRQIEAARELVEGGGKPEAGQQPEGQP